MDRLFEGKEMSLILGGSTLRVVMSCIYSLWVFHAVACLYWFIASREGLGISDWTPPVEYWAYPNSLKYLCVLCWTVSTTFGNQPPTFPELMGEAVFTITAVLVGILLSSYVIGLTNSALASADPEEEEKRLRMDKMLGFLKRNNIPTFFQRVVINFYENEGEKSTEQILDNLPAPISVRMSLLLNRHLINIIPLMHGLPLNCILLLMQLLTLTVHLPGHYVISSGDDPTTLYFVKKGSVQISVDREGMPIRALAPGDMLGHIALFHRRPHALYARCVGYAELLSLDVTHYDEACKEFEDFRDAVSNEVKREEKAMDAALKNLNRHNKLNKAEKVDANTAAAAKQADDRMRKLAVLKMMFGNKIK
jgi:CRP-like cAMP-binding protein